MKPALRAAAVLALAAAATTAWLLTRPAPPAPPPLARPNPAPQVPVPAAEEPLALRRNEDAAEVFRRAFWREPASADRILHAERREWISARDGVRRWQWFLAVSPGPELAEWLRGNPFRLARAAQPSLAPGAAERPDWFPDAPALARCEVEASPEPGMMLAWERAGGLLYATDAGGGFARPADAAPVAAR